MSFGYCTADPDTRYYRYLGLSVALLPLLSISTMIFMLGGATSPYYAGLNLIMLGSAILLRWSVFDSVLIFGLTLLAYLAASLLHGLVENAGGFFSTPESGGIFFNNLYFLLVTGVFIVAGSWYYNSLRRSEFLLRYRAGSESRRAGEHESKAS